MVSDLMDQRAKKYGYNTQEEKLRAHLIWQIKDTNYGKKYKINLSCIWLKVLVSFAIIFPTIHNIYSNEISYYIDMVG